jgi:hypothetical protein
LLCAFSLLLEFELQDLVFVEALEGLLVAEGAHHVRGGGVLGWDDNHVFAVLTRHRV